MSTISRSSNTHDMLLSAFNSLTCVHSFFFTCHAEIVVATLEAFVSDTHHRCVTAIASNSTMSVANPVRTPGRLVGYPHVTIIIFEIWMTYWVFNERDSKSKAKHYVSLAVLVIELHNPFGFHNNLCKIDIKMYHASSESGSETIVNFLWFWLLQKKCSLGTYLCFTCDFHYDFINRGTVAEKQSIALRVWISRCDVLNFEQGFFRTKKLWWKLLFITSEAKNADLNWWASCQNSFRKGRRLVTCELFLKYVDDLAVLWFVFVMETILSGMFQSYLLTLLHFSTGTFSLNPTWEHKFAYLRPFWLATLYDIFRTTGHII